MTSSTVELMQCSVLGSVLLAAASVELYFFLKDTSTALKTSYISSKRFFGRFFTWLNRLYAVFNDFRSYKFYNPLKSSRQAVIVHDVKHIRELSQAQELSQRAIYGDMFGFKHTMNNLDHNEQRISRSRLYGRVLNVNGPKQLTSLFTDLQQVGIDAFNVELQKGKQVGPSKSIKLASSVRRTVSRMMCRAFFGERLTKDVEFREALLRYSADMVASMGAFQVTPGFLAPTVHRWITNNGAAMHLILSRVNAELHALDLSAVKDHSERDPEPTILHTMADTIRGHDYWNNDLLAQAILGIWFAASHQPWMNLDFTILELCARPDAVADLRSEILSTITDAGDETALDYQAVEHRMPLLDSFIKETIRVNPLDTLAIRRKALKPFQFTNGPAVPLNSMACTSSYDQMHDANAYPNPHAFNAKRFAPDSSTKSSMRGARLVDVSDKFPVWGFGSLACPGRFHASLMMKLVLVHLITRYDFQFRDEKAPRQWRWETFTMPFEKTEILVRPLEDVQ
ncbi:hypothetical protein MMC10_007234 [Thelotrema lepadinum]|nr:hypothetical protein [Thelotrema lepadinum]